MSQIDQVTDRFTLASPLKAVHYFHAFFNAIDSMNIEDAISFYRTTKKKGSVEFGKITKYLVQSGFNGFVDDDTK